MRVATIRITTAAALIQIAGTALAQSAPKTYYACYVPLTGTVYRIKEADLKQACTATSHIEFSWVDGANAVRATDPLGGDLTGVLGNASVARLLGRALATTPPTAGQALVFDGTAWKPSTIAAGGSTDDGFVAGGTFGGGTIPATGSGVRLMWYPKKAAIRAGLDQPIVGGTNAWDDVNIGQYSTAFGISPVASGFASVAIGGTNKATGQGAVAIGYGATARGVTSAAIGFVAEANGDASMALGNFVRADHQGAFVYGDGNGIAPIVTSQVSNEFVVRASGGFRLRTNPFLTTGCDLPAGSGTWNCTSSRDAKEAFADLDADSALTRIERLPIQSWIYRTDSTRARHVGPTAQDFRAAFGLGNSAEAIGLVDIDGINMLGVQALARRTNAQAQTIERLRTENARQAERLAELERAVRRLEALIGSSPP